MLIIFSSLYSQYYCWNTDFEKCYSTRVCWEGFNRCAFQAIAPFSRAQISLVFIVLDYCRTWSGQEMSTLTCNLRSQKSAPSMVMLSRYVSFAPLSLLVLAAPKCHLLTFGSRRTLYFRAHFRFLFCPPSPFDSLTLRFPREFRRKRPSESSLSFQE